MLTIAASARMPIASAEHACAKTLKCAPTFGCGGMERRCENCSASLSCCARSTNAVGGCRQKIIAGEPLVEQMQQAQRAVSRLIDAYAEGVLEKHEFEPRLARARQRVERLKQRPGAIHSARCPAEQLRASLACLDDFSETDSATAWTKPTGPTRREIIRTLVERVRYRTEPSSHHLPNRLPPFCRQS